MACSNPAEKGNKRNNLEQQIHASRDDEIPLAHALPEIWRNTFYHLNPANLYPCLVLRRAARAVTSYFRRKADGAAYKTTSFLIKNAACIDEEDS